MLSVAAAGAVLSATFTAAAPGTPSLSEVDSMDDYVTMSVVRLREHAKSLIRRMDAEQIHTLITRL